MARWFRNLTLNKLLAILGSAAAVLAVITYAVVFYGGGTYIVNSPLPTDTAVTETASSTASSTAFLGGAASSSASSTGNASSTLFAQGNGSTTLAEYSSSYSAPPMSWTEGYDTISVTGATLSGSQLTLSLDIKMGSTAECVPLNLRLITDEKGDLAAPLTPAFTFGENGTCIGTPGTDYPNQQVTFTVDPSMLPFSFTTGGTSDKYFELSTTPAGGIVITPPPTAG